MANVNRPKGLSPIQTADGNPWNSQANLYSIPNDTSYTYALGDVVILAAGSDTNGVPNVIKYTSAEVASPAAGTLPVGVIVGIRVANPGVSLVAPNLSLNTVYLPKSSGQAYVYVVDDMNVIFELQGDSTTWATSNANNNVSITVTNDQTSTLSQSSPYSSTVATAPATTNSLPLQILGYIQRPDNVVGAYAALRVRFNLASQIGSTTGRTGV